ncbi:hypothetical protein GGS21DRAFT_537606 [Xylaria nigripes]|nr:hypothetical protein GGS21DRAFT_537606 [Xylaria nigripes]
MAPEVPITQPKCANGGRCEKPAIHPCRDCYLVAYCSSRCKNRHKSIHNKKCKKVLQEAQFERECRLPTWAPQTLHEDLMKRYNGAAFTPSPPIDDENVQHAIHEDKKERCQFDLFGDHPAIDVLRLEENEGVDRKEPIDLLFVEPTDLRDVIKTIVDLPLTFSAPLRVVITDVVSARTARNLILLLMAISSSDPEATAECAVHLWYGPFIPDWCIPAIREDINPYLYGDGPEEADDEDDFMSELRTGTYRTWSFHRSSLKALLTHHVWTAAKAILHPCSPCIGVEGAYRAREIAAQELADTNKDLNEKTVLNFPQMWRTAKQQYMAFSQLAPFEDHLGDDPSSYDWNPSLFHDEFWPLKPDVEPLRGWELAEINQYRGSLEADNDIYGKMFYTVRQLFKSFILRLRVIPVEFEVHPFSGYLVPKYIEGQFDRIETSNLADEDQVGACEVVEKFSPLLKDPSVNPHATLITFHPGVFDKIRNAFPCPTCDPARAHRVKVAVDLKDDERELLDMYLPQKEADPVKWVTTLVGWQRRDARWLFRDPAYAWELYKDIFGFGWAERQAQVALKPTNTVVEEWVFCLKYAGQLDDQGQLEHYAEWEFDTIMALNRTTGYRYAEWQKLSEEYGEEGDGKPKKRKKRKRVEKHELHHEYLNDDTLADLKEQGLELETWMGVDNCENWTPY